MSVLAPVISLGSDLKPPPAGSDRRADVDAKQAFVADLLSRHGCDGLLILDQANLAWLTSGGLSRAILDPEELPALYFTGTQRWLVSANYDTQRMFDEEIDGLGFLLKEWPWHWRRERILLDLCHQRSVACDAAMAGTRPVGDELRHRRRVLSSYEQACYEQLGQLLAHALEATCRGAEPGQTERELAGQLSHRLLHRGASVAAISVAADGHSRLYRRHGFTSTPVERHAVLTATARKYGLYATASRSFSFGPTDEEFKKEHFAACKVAATYIASTWPDAVIGDVLHAGERVYELTGYEHEWRLAPQGSLIGRSAMEQGFFPDSDDLLPAGAAVVWHPSVGAATCADTFLVTDSGPVRLTIPVDWPLVSVKVSGAEFVCPSILER